MRYRVFLLFLLFMSLIYKPCFADGYLLGDANADGKLSVADLVAMVKTARGDIKDITSKVDDINMDGVLTLADIDLFSNILTCKSDTIRLFFKGTDVFYLNPYPADSVTITVPSGSADVVITNNRAEGMVLSLQGISENGRIYVDSKSEYKLILNGISLTSAHAPAFNSVSSEKVKVKIADNTTNTFCDATKYSLIDSESASGCFNSMGQMSFSGDGTLNVKGKSKHAIYCKKSITINNGTINVNEATSDALHSGKHVSINGGTVTLTGMDGDGIDLDDDFTMTGGTLQLDVTGEAAKGVKCGGVMDISGGTISATASGALKNKDGDLSYCTILKCDSCMTISGGDFHLINDSPGGKCISADRNLTISGGTIYAETNGDGAEYTNADGEIDYYTAKCIAADINMYLNEGQIQCLSTGLGGKGIVASANIYGRYKDCDNEDCLNVLVETRGWSVIDDATDDVREGCPKAIKAGKFMYMYGGKFDVHTQGMGGEGLEARGMKMYGGDIICNTYDDGINLQQDLTMKGGKIYCNSSDNDGIDSNGGIKIYDGNVFSISQHLSDESFDTENFNFHVYGGTVIGLSPSFVDVGSSEQPIYWEHTDTFSIKEGQEYLVKDTLGNLLNSFCSQVTMEHCRLTISLPQFEDGATYTLVQEDGQVIKEFIPTLCNN